MLCAIYARLSREDEAKQLSESESIQNQKSLLARYATEQGWAVYDVYCDEDRSGADAGRPDFNRMLRDARARRFEIILCKSQSRFTRDLELVEKYIHGLFPLWGIRFIALADNADTEVKGNKKARQINGLVNEWYLEDLSESIRMVLDHKRRQGLYIGSHSLYGYRKDPENKNRLLVDEPAADVVRQIFAWYLSGHGPQHIARLLNDRKIDSPARHRQPADLSGTGLWSKATVWRILHNEMYTGVMVQGRRKKISYKSRGCIDRPPEEWFRVEGTHQAIITPETFQKAQARTRRPARPDAAGKTHPLAGLVRCMDCGSTLVKTSNGRSQSERICYLRCRLSSMGGSPPPCTRHSIRLDRLIELVSQRLRDHVAACYELGDITRFARAAERQEPTQALRAELRALEGELERRAAALKSLYLDRASGLLSQSQFFAMNRDFLAEKRSISGRVGLLRRTLSETSGGLSSDKLTARLNALLALDPIPRELFVMAIDHIEVGEKDPCGRQEVHIYWKF